MRLLLFFCCSWWAQASFAQPGFNKGYSLGYNFNQFFDVIVKNDTIVAYGSGQDSLTGFQKGILVARFDTFGNRLDQALILDTTNNIYSIDKSWGKIISTSDGGFAMTTTTLYGRDGAFIKLKHNLELEFVQRYRDTINEGESLVAPIEIPEGYLLYGYFNHAGNTKLDALIRKVDKQGNMIWRKNFGVYYWHESFETATILNDSFILINGTKNFEYPNWYETSKPWLCVFNLHGDLLYQWEPSSPEAFNGIRIGRLMPNQDSTWTAYGLKSLGPHPVYGWERYQIYWIRLDKNFQYLWSKPFGPTMNKLDILLKIIQAPDGDIIGIGQRGPFDSNVEGFYQKGWVMRFSQEADSLWEWTGKMPIPNPGAHFLSGGALLSSGSIVAAGSGDGTNGYPYCWLVKLSPDGCVDTLFYHTTSTLQAPKEEGLALRVYPNPVSEALYVTTLKDNVAKIRLLSITGQTLSLFEFPANIHECSIPVQGIKPGIYFLKVVSEKGNTEIVKIAIQH